METRILSNVELHGALIFTKNEEEFPLSPKLGTMIIKDQCLFAYIKIGGLETWYPFANRTNSYIHTQGLSSLTWTVNHNLGTSNIWYQVKDTNGNIILVGKTDIDDNSFQLNFTTPTLGTVIVVAPEDIDVPVVKASVIQIGSGEVLIDSSGVLINGSYALTSANFETQISNAVAAEATIRASADTTLQNAINAEITARTTADTTLQNAINAEITARTTADTTLQNAINAEITARINADANQFVLIESTVSSTTPTVIDTWANTFRTAKYIVQISQGTSYQSSEILVINGVESPVWTEYAILETNGSLCNFTVNRNGTDTQLLVTMANSASANIKIKRMLIQTA